MSTRKSIVPLICMAFSPLPALAYQDSTAPNTAPGVRITVAVDRPLDLTEGEALTIPGLDPENQDDVLGVPGLVWQQVYTADDIKLVYPRRAARRRQSGQADLQCTILDTGQLQCAVTGETPRGWSFGDAALELADTISVAPTLNDGSPSSGQVITLPFQFDPDTLTR